MKSMTGFGRSSNRLSQVSSRSLDRSKASKGRGNASKKASRSAEVSLDISVRSVNGRFLDTRLHLPREYAGMESDVKSIVSKYFSRGTLDIYVNRSKPQAASGINVNLELAEKWLKGYRALGQALKIKAEPNVEFFAKIPDIFQVDERSEASEQEKKLMKELLEEALKACDKERQREGKALSNELLKLCSDLENLVEKVHGLRGEANADLEKRYRERLQKLGFQGMVEDQRIAQEIVIQLDRSEISEELTRLREHIKAYRQLIKHEESQGKKLDFYAQELLREVNTIGSKSQVARLTSLVVDAKTVVEKIREQVQNVE